MRSIGLVVCLASALAQAAPAPAADAPSPAGPAAASEGRLPAPLSPVAVSAGMPGLAPPGAVPAAPAVDDGGTIETTSSYRWQIAAADTAAVTLVLVGGERTLKLAAMLYLVDGLAIHAAHREPNRAVLSLLMRAGLPFLAARGASALCRCGDDEDDGGAIAGFALGLLTAMITDAALIAQPVTVRRPRTTAWTPRIQATHDRVTLGFSARF
jgi:hypothetical protein